MVGKVLLKSLDQESRPRLGRIEKFPFKIWMHSYPNHDHGHGMAY